MTDTVILIHAIFRTKRCMSRIERALRAQGYNVVNVGYPSTRFTLEELAVYIHPAIQKATAHGGQVHFVGYSMGGLLIRTYLAAYAPANLGKVIMLGTPNQGSQVADRIQKWKLYRWLYGPAGQQLTTHTPCPHALPTCILGIIAGSRSYDPIFGRYLPGIHDGKVSVENTKLPDMADHITLPVCHTLMPESNAVIAQVVSFLQTGKFER